MKIEKVLISQMMKKDHQAYNTFYLQTVDMFYRYLMWRYVLRWEDAEDVLSDFYMKFWRVVERYDDTYAFETYMRTVFRNIVKDYFKKWSIAWLSADEDEIVDDTHSETTLLTLLEQDYQLSSIQEAMKHIDEYSYDIIYLKFIEEKSYEEISLLFWLSQDAVRQRISRTLKKIKALCEQSI